MATLQIPKEQRLGSTEFPGTNTAGCCATWKTGTSVSPLIADLLPFPALHNQLDETSVIRQFRAWVAQKFGIKP